jgi:2OG-Fe(II) oxygenase superfamily
MSTIVSTSICQGFSAPGVHSIIYKDDFCDFAAEVREELLRYPKWKEMTQGGAGGRAVFSPDRQNGITVGHIREQDRDRLPYCLKFRDLIARNFGAFCPLVDVDPKDAGDVEISAMAYGAGAWLSSHTDFLEYGRESIRLAAWMFYLTAPEDGEWPLEKGGAVRVWAPGLADERVRPRFNRFAMFRVHNTSFHEIEKVTWEPEWPNCRLALSGWILGHPAKKIELNARMYLQSSTASRKSEEIEAALQGSMAYLRLLVKQKKYCGLATGPQDDQISEFEKDYQAHKEAPPGTSFLRRVAGHSGCSIVVNEVGETVHFGTIESYRKKFQDPSG